ncbi:Similar to mRNA turnover protein 4 homolog; acc. no. Q7S302 [Pyronema omphalodes CBS 100304]|uniref:Ribosome assembly factor mrt4 n=1 Tax=Pyronema omphalodes (strain CBS 100304) TaxID=1076935 RepID=U4KYB7_PYROM|nr:Similar to mRNA turnover protein 4 homolog; acc. no. Q7S302 [Pyronema omphalodes CBS 100304]
MPVSKRNKQVSLTQTTKKPARENNERLFTNIQESVDTYPTILVFSVANMRNTYLKNVRSELSDSRLFFGKTKVTAKALGLTGETELRPGLAKLTKHINGNVGLIFSPRKPEELIEYFENFVKEDFARMGAVSPIDFVVPAGVVYSLGGQMPAEDDVPLAHSLETTVRALGMPTKLNKGKVWLDQEYVLCKEGQKLDSKQAALLKLFGRMTAEFAVTPTAYWTSETEEVTVLEKEDAMEA